MPPPPTKPTMSINKILILIRTPHTPPQPRRPPPQTNQSINEPHSIPMRVLSKLLPNAFGTVGAASRGFGRVDGVFGRSARVQDAAFDARAGTWGWRSDGAWEGVDFDGWGDWDED